MIPGLVLPAKDEQNYTQWLKRFVRENTRQTKKDDVPNAVRVSRGSNQTIVTGTVTNMLWTTQVPPQSSLSSMFNAGTSAMVGRAPRAGWYGVGAHLRWQAVAAGNRILYLYSRPAGTTGAQDLLWNQDENLGSLTINTPNTISTLIWLDTHDQVFFNVWQNSGGNLDVLFNFATTGHTPNAFMFEVR